MGGGGGEVRVVRLPWNFQNIQLREQHFQCYQGVFLHAHFTNFISMYITSLPFDDFADCLGNFKVVHRSYTFYICAEQPYPDIYSSTRQLRWNCQSTDVVYKESSKKLIFYISLKCNAYLFHKFLIFLSKKVPLFENKIFGESLLIKDLHLFTEHFVTKYHGIIWNSESWSLSIL